jgi:hypothetical protein
MQRAPVRQDAPFRLRASPRRLHRRCRAAPRQRAAHGAREEQQCGTEGGLAY